MTPDTITRPRSASSPPDPRPSSDDWWSARSTEELKAMVGTGFAGGDQFARAAREIERRLNIRNNAEDAAELARERRLSSYGRGALIASILFVLVSLGALIWMVTR